MSVKPDISHFSVFPPCSTSIITGPSFCGKSHLIKHFLTHLQVYFASFPSAIIIVYCNNKAGFYQFETEPSVPVYHFYFDEFDPESIVQNAVLIFEDVSFFHSVIKEAINVWAHHYPLSALFVVSQNIIGNSHFEFVKLCHKILFCLRSNASISVVKYIINKFYSDNEVKRYLDSVLSFCEKQKTTLLLDLNSPVGASDNFVAYSHLDSLPLDHILAYSSLPFQSNYTLNAEKMPNSSIINNKVQYPSNTFVMVPVEHVLEKQEAHNKQECTNESNFETTKEIIFNDIDVHISDFKKIKHAKALANALLHCNLICVTADGTFAHILNKPKTQINIIDFIQVAIRKAGPNELEKPEWKLYKMYVKLLLQRGKPQSMFKNVLLLK